MQGKPLGSLKIPDLAANNSISTVSSTPTPLQVGKAPDITRDDTVPTKKSEVETPQTPSYSDSDTVMIKTGDPEANEETETPG